MATTTGGCVFRVTPVVNPGEGWYWAGHGELRRSPSGTGVGSFLQAIGWPRVDISQTALDEMIDAFGQGPDFT